MQEVARAKVDVGKRQQLLEHKIRKSWEKVTLGETFLLVGTAYGYRLG